MPEVQSDPMDVAGSPTAVRKSNTAPRIASRALEKVDSAQTLFIR
jgi:hypothetical protein